MDPNNEADRAKLAQLPEEEGVWKVAANAEVITKYLRAVIKFGIPPYQRDGKWFYDNSIAIVKRDRPEKGNVRLHLRGEIFDFERALKQAHEAATKTT